MDLTFNKIGNSYVAEFTAEADFNLHIERVSSGYLRVEQRTSANGAYGLVTGMDEYAFMKVIDADFVGGVFPKGIKVVSESQPTLAVVTFNA
jgi:hypothetical protein